MTVQEASQIAHQDPVPTLTARWGETVTLARQRVAALTDSLRDLDKLADTLAEHDLTIATDLGPIGNAAHAAWVTVSEHKADHPHPFELPRSA